MAVASAAKASYLIPSNLGPHQRGGFFLVCAGGWFVLG